MFKVNKQNFIAAFKRHASIRKNDPSHFISALNLGISWYNLHRTIKDWQNEIFNALLDASDKKDKGHITELMSEFSSGKIEVDEFCRILDSVIVDIEKEETATNTASTQASYIVLKAYQINQPANDEMTITMVMNESIKNEIIRQSGISKTLKEAIPLSLKVSTSFVNYYDVEAENALEFETFKIKTFSSKIISGHDNLPKIIKDCFLKDDKKNIISYFIMVGENALIWFLIKTFDKDGNEVILISEKFDVNSFLIK